MSDLISRKAVLDKLKDFSNMYTLEEEARIVLDTIVRIVTEQPTAYSVEKVVAELEEELKNAQMEYTLGKYNLDNGIGENYRQDMNEGRCFAYDSAIDIVRKGGVE